MLTRVDAELDSNLALAQVESGDLADLNASVCDVGACVKTAGAGHEDRDRERLRQDAHLQDVEHDVVDADHDHEQQGDHPR